MTAKYSLFGPVMEALGRAAAHPVSRAIGNAATSPLAVGLAAGAAPALVGHAVGAVERSRDRTRAAKAQAEAYRDMMRLHPRLQQADPDTVHRYYGTLARFNPAMATDPTVSGAWLTNIIENESELGALSGGQTLLKSIGDLASIRNNMSTALERERGRGGVGMIAEKTVGSGISEHLKRKDEEQRGDLQRALKDLQLKNESMLDEAQGRMGSGFGDFYRGVSKRYKDKLDHPKI